MHARIPGPFHISVLLCGLIVAGGGALHAAPKTDAVWKPATAAELASMASQIEPDVPAEVLEHEISIDDRGFPGMRRSREYLRLKIYDTTNIEELTRIAQRWSAEDTDVVIRARLTLPDGTTTEFGAEAVRERSLTRRGREASFLERLVAGRDPEVKEKFLAVTGITAGAVLETVIEREEEAFSLVSLRMLQRATTPTRRVSFVHQAPGDADFDHRLFLLNPSIGDARLVDDTKKRTTTITASRVPSWVDEPFAGATADSALVAFSSYAQKHLTFATRGPAPKIAVDPVRDGQWAPLAVRTFVWQEGQSASSPGTLQLARELSVGTATREELAARIHEQVQALHQGFRQRKKTGKSPAEPATSLDDVIAWKACHERLGISTDDFRFLALAIYRDAGFEATTFLLPDRKQIRFDTGMVSVGLLPQKCIGVKLGEQWHFSLVTSNQALPFDMLPWENEGQVALCAKAGPEEFVEIPFRPAEKSLVATTGRLALDEAGTLSGTLTRTYHGHAAYLVRGHLRDQSPEKQTARIHDSARDDLGFEEIGITALRNADDFNKPLEIECTVRHPGYAVVAGERMIIRAAPTHLEGKSPFTSDTRRAAVQFPFAWGETDRIAIELPVGFQPESLPAPTAVREGKLLAFATQIKFDATRRVLSVSRAAAVKDWLFEVSDYPALKRWFDSVAAADEAELVLVKSAVTP